MDGACNYTYRNRTFFQLRQQASFDLFISFSPWFWQGCKNWFWFSFLVWLFYLPFFRSLVESYCFYSAKSVKLTGNNSLTNLLNLRILTSLELFFNHELYCRLPALSYVYNNGKTVPEKIFFASYELESYGTVRIA